MQYWDELAKFTEWVLSLKTGGLIEGKARAAISHYHQQKEAVVQSNMELIRLWIDNSSPDDLRTLRAIINGKLGKRQITPEQQTAMQAARKKKTADK